jgi:hypothetical protein
MQVLGSRAAMAFGSDPGIKAWADTVALNPARVSAEVAGSADVEAVISRFRTYVAPGIARMAELAHMS